MKRKKGLSLLVALTMIFSILFPGMAYGAGNNSPEDLKKVKIYKEDNTSPKIQLMRIMNILEEKKTLEGNPLVGDDKVRLVIKSDGRDISKALMRVGAKVTREISTDTYAVEIHEENAKKLLKIEGIKKIALEKYYMLDPIERTEVDRPLKGFEPDLETTHDDTKADAFRSLYGYDGSDIVIAILDTGVDVGHEMLQYTTGGDIKIIDWKDFTGEGDVLLSSAGEVFSDTVAGTVYHSVYGGDTKYIVPAEIAVGETVYLGAINEYDTLYRYAAYGRYPDLVEFDFNGNIRDSFPILAAKDSRGEYSIAYVDTNRNNDFSDEVQLIQYDKGIGEGKRYVAKFPRLDATEKDPKDGREVHFVLTAMEEGEDGVFVNLGYDGGEHGTHVAGIAAGNGTLKGIAPGAKIMALKVLGSHGGGGMSGIMAAMKYAAENGADIVNMSLGSFSDINDGSHPEAELANELTEKYGTIFCISAGNNGPGINTPGSPGDADKAIASGAYIEHDTWRKDYGSEVPGEGLWRFSSIGPREDGAIKPDIISPGSAYSSVPVWDDYITRHVPGYDVYQGTSMASPHTAGLAALLYEAARKENIADKIDFHLLREALQETARKLEDLQVVEQGGGLVDVVKAYDYVKEKASGKKYNIKVNTNYNERLNYSTGIYIRNHEMPEKVVVEVTNYENKDITLNLTKSGDASWYTLMNGTFNVPANGSAQFRVYFDTTIGHGLYSDIVRIDSPDTEWIDGVLPITIARGQSITDDYVVQGEIASAHYDRNFIKIPSGIDKMRVRLQPIENAEGQLGKLRSIASYPNGMLAYDTYNSKKPNGGYVGLGAPDPTAPVEYSIENPVPGVWEINTYANFDTGNLQKEAYGRASNTAAYEMTVIFEGIAANPDNFTAEVEKGSEVSKEFTFTNLTGEDKNILVQGSNLIDLGNLPAPSVIELEFGSNSEYESSFTDTIVITEEDPNYLLKLTTESLTYPKGDDFDLYLYDSKGNVVAKDESGDAQESISIAGLPADTYTVEVMKYAAAGDPTIIRYSKQVVNISAGNPEATVKFDSEAPEHVHAKASWTKTATCAVTDKLANAGSYGGLIFIKDSDADKTLTQLPVNITVVEGNMNPLNIQKQVKAFYGGIIRYNNPASIYATADKPVVWEVTIKDVNGVAVKTLKGKLSKTFEQLWTPSKNDPSGTYTFEFTATTADGEVSKVTESVEVYNLAAMVKNIATLDVNGKEEKEFQLNNIVYVKATIEKIDKGVTGFAIVQVKDANGKPYALRFVPVSEGTNEYPLGFNLQGVGKGSHTVEVYVWKGLLEMEPLSLVKTFEFTVK